MKRLYLRLLKGAAVLLGLFVLVFAAGVLWPLNAPEPAERDARLLLAGVRLVDVESGAIREGVDVLVVDGRIEQVGMNLTDAAARRIDARGRYAVPGLFDMHVHSFKTSPALTHPLFIAAGVTAVRDMGGCIGAPDAWVACAEDKRAWTAAVEAGRMVGPRYDQITGLAVNGGSEIPASLDAELGVPTAESARGRIAHDRARGLDFIKTYTRLPRDAYLALAAEARVAGLYLAGHLPLAVSGFEAAQAGQRSIEHALMFLFECYPAMDELRDSEPREAYTDASRRDMLDRHDPELCARLRRALRDADVVLVPTHTTRRLDAFASDEAFRSDARLEYIPGPLRMLWHNDADGMAARGSQATYAEVYRFGIEQSGLAHRAGVTVLAGTDTPDSFVFPGSSLHDELDHLVAAGLSPLAALRSATLAPARFLGLEGQAGVIAPGARADIVLLSADPLADIRAVRAIEAVVLAGAFYGRDDLDALKQSVEHTANSWTMWPKFAWQIARSPIMRRQFAD